MRTSVAAGPSLESPLLPKGSEFQLEEPQVGKRSCCLCLFRWCAVEVKSGLACMANACFLLGALGGMAGLGNRHPPHGPALLASRVLGGCAVGMGAFFAFKFVINTRACAAGGPRWQMLLGLIVLVSGVASSFLAFKDQLKT